MTIFCPHCGAINPEIQHQWFSYAYAPIIWNGTGLQDDDATYYDYPELSKDHRFLMLCCHVYLGDSTELHGMLMEHIGLEDPDA